MKAIAIAAAATFAMSTAALAGGPVLMTDQQLDQVVAGGATPPQNPPPDNIVVRGENGPIEFNCTSGGGEACKVCITCRFPVVSVDGTIVTPTP